jgi:hypothetical protein
LREPPAAAASATAKKLRIIMGAPFAGCEERWCKINAASAYQAFPDVESRERITEGAGATGSA